MSRRACRSAPSSPPADFGSNEARILGDRTLEFSPGHAEWEAHALHRSATLPPIPIGSMRGRADAHYREALALAKPRGMRPLIAHCHLGLGKLYRRTGKRDQAQEHLTTATTMYREMDMRFWLKQVEAEMKELA